MKECRMPQLAPPPLSLAEAEREQLHQLINRHRTPQQLALIRQYYHPGGSGR
jgi:hypothetical protein